MDHNCKLIVLYNCDLLITDITIRFNQSLYSVDEDSGVVQPVLVLNRLSSTNITVYIRDSSNNATSE